MNKIFFGLFVGFLSNSCMFVGQTDSKYYEVHPTNKAETKIYGQHTVESTAVLSILRIESVCSDCPFSFTSNNLFFMQTEMDKRAKPALNQQVTADDVINMITISGEIDSHLDNLRDLMDHFFLHYKRPTKHYKQSVFHSYYIISDALKLVRQIQKNEKQYGKVESI